MTIRDDRRHRLGGGGPDDVAPLRGKKVSDIIAREIVYDIMARGLGAGDRLETEQMMLSRYGVGRASLREALRILEIQGLIQIKPGPGGGPVVSAVDARDFSRLSTLYLHVMGSSYSELVHARSEIEAVLARLAALHDGRDARRLESYLEHARTEAIDDDEHWLETSNEFHGIIAEMSGNSVLSLFATALKHILSDRVRKALIPMVEREEARSIHEAIGVAILKGDGAKAEKLMLEHMRDFVSRFSELHPNLFNEVVDWH